MSEFGSGAVIGFTTAIAIVLVWSVVSSAAEHRACRELTGSTCKWVLVPTYEKVN
jgi:hypothetical protein